MIKTLEEAITQNVLFNQRVTLAEVENKLNNISTTRGGMVQEGERIISKGEVVTLAKYQILESLKKEYQDRASDNSNFRLILLGQVILVSVSMLVLILFYMFSERKYLKIQKNSTDSPNHYPNGICNQSYDEIRRRIYLHYSIMYRTHNN